MVEGRHACGPRHRLNGRLAAAGAGGRELHGLRCVATSPATERAARALGLGVEELDGLGELDMAIDGADQIDPEGWLIKGGGGAHTREKIVAAPRAVCRDRLRGEGRASARPAGAARAAALRRAVTLAAERIAPAEADLPRAPTAG